MRNLFTCCLFLLVVYVAGAQTLTVIDQSDQKVVADVAVYNNAKSFSAVSNANGKVKLSGLLPSDTIRIQHPSYYNETYKLVDVAAMGYKLQLLERTIQLEEYVVAASKTREKVEDVSHQIEVINASRIQFTNAPTTAEVLESTGNVFVQRSQMGGGSPVLRGFEANKVLLVIDGVRMNTAIYRSGHLQNAITIDPSIIDRTEVVFGPGSLIYGSDALGGVMHFYTKRPQLSNDSTMRVLGNAYGRFASASFQKTGHIDLSLGWKRVASFTSFSYTDFDDLRMGSVQPPTVGAFGKRNHYVDRINGQDTMLVNNDPFVQRGTGYSQYDAMQKFLIDANDKLDVILNFQFSTTSNIPRYDRLREYEDIVVTEPIGEIVLLDTILTVDSTYETQRLAFATWDYGPQFRLLSSATFDLKSDGPLYNEAQLIVAYQRIKESRITRRFGRSGTTHREESLHVYSLNFDLFKDVTPSSTLQYGLEVLANDVQSTAFEEDINTGERSEASTRYPEGGSFTQSYAAYAKYSIRAGEKVIIAPGFRYTQYLLSARFTDTDFFNFEFNGVNLNTAAFSGAFSIVYNPGKQWNIRTVFSSGFRAPNVDDIGKVFDPNPAQVVVPNQNLKPEYVYNLELGINKKFGERLHVGATIFNTIIRNAILRQEFLFNNQDSLEYEGVLSEVYANVNTGQAVIRGFNFELEADLNENFAFRSNLTYTYGRDITNDVPLSHIPPVYGSSSVLSRFGKFRGELMLQYNGWKRLEDYGPGGEDNLSDATPLGAPSWFVVNIRTGYQFNPYFGIQFAVDNILDRHYRIFSSGVSAPGRNYIVTAKVSFGK